MEHEISSHNNQRLAMEGEDTSLEGAAMKGLKRSLEEEGFSGIAPGG